MKKRFIFLISIYLLPLLVSCQISGYQNSSNVDSECIKPPVSFAQTDIGNLGTKNVLLPISWEMVTELPDVPDGALGQYSIALIRERNQYDEIWIHWCWDFVEPKANIECGYIVFRTDTDTWEVITQREDNIISQLPRRLFLTNSGDVWGVKDFSFGEQYSILARYNENQQAFESIRDLDQVLNENSLPSVDSFSIDGDGVLWMVHAGTLFEYSPSTNIASKYTIIKDSELTLSDITVLSNGDLALSINGKKEITIFSTDTKMIKDKITIDLPIREVPPIYGEHPAGMYYQISESFLSHDERLWIHNYGWMEPDGSWRMILSRFPGFFGIWQEELEYYDWLTPSIIAESSDGSLWYGSANGTVRFDPQKGDWCWITTERSNVVEDQNKNVWMLAGGKLYKYPLEQ